MMGKRKYVASGNDTEGRYVEKELWASSAKDALTIVQASKDGVTYTAARKVGCGCGGA